MAVETLPPLPHGIKAEKPAFKPYPIVRFSSNEIFHDGSASLTDKGAKIQQVILHNKVLLMDDKLEGNSKDKMTYTRKSEMRDRLEQLCADPDVTLYPHPQSLTMVEFGFRRAHIERMREIRNNSNITDFSSIGDVYDMRNSDNTTVRSAAD